MTDHSTRRDWDHYMHGRPPLTDYLLDRHLGRTGAAASASRDPAAHLQVAVLRDFLRVLQCALDDENIDPDTTRRVIERVIYGGVPQPAVVEQLLTERQLRVEQLSLGPVAKHFMEGGGGR